MSNYVTVFKALADKTRMKIINSLMLQAKCGTDLAEELELPQPHIAHHIGILRNAEIVEPKRVGHKVEYFLKPTLFSKSEGNVSLNLGEMKILLGQ